MQELVDKGELAPIWRERMVPGENDAVFADHCPALTNHIGAPINTARILDHWDDLKTS